MRRLTTATLAALVLLLAASASPAGDYWLRLGGSLNLLAMDDFNDGVAQMNALVEDAYRQEILADQPGLSDDALQRAVDAAASGNLLDELDTGIGLSVALARRLGAGLSVGFEFERMIGVSDIVHSPAVAMDYSAPVSMSKIFVSSHLRERGRVSLGVGGAVGYAKADGWLTMPANNPRTAMRDAYLTGGGLLLEGQVLAHLRLEEGFAICATVGYRRAELGESDQHWFAESGSPAPGSIELDDSIPLQLDFSGPFVKTGIQIDLP